jgi:hypothetical protein
MALKLRRATNVEQYLDEGKEEESACTISEVYGISFSAAMHVVEDLILKKRISEIEEILAAMRS